MNKFIPAKNIPLLTLGAGGLALALRRALYIFGADSQGLLAEPHFLHIAYWVLTAAVAGFLAVSVFSLDGSNRYEDNFPASPTAAAGGFLGAAGILATVLTGGGDGQTITTIRTVLGILAALGLGAVGVCRYLGRRPFFLFTAAAFGFFALNLVWHYRDWSGDPQSQNYVFPLLASICLMLSAYYRTAFAADMGHRRALLLSSLMAAFLCCLSLIPLSEPFLYLGCGAWVYLDLCPLPPPRRRRRRRHPGGEEPASEPETAHQEENL